MPVRNINEKVYSELRVSPGVKAKKNFTMKCLTTLLCDHSGTRTGPTSEPCCKVLQREDEQKEEKGATNPILPMPALESEQADKLPS